MSRPESNEYAEFYAGYINCVPEGDILTLLSTEHERTAELLRGLTPEQARHRYEPGKWSVREVVGHMIDSERAFGYRALCFAREEPAHLPGFEQTDYAASSNADRRTMADLVEELCAVRQSQIALFRSLDEPMWSHRGIASDCEFTVRAVAYIIVGHQVHHRTVIEQRYLNGAI